MVQEGRNALHRRDRAVVALRHFELLNRAKTAQVPGTSEDATAKRYIRALRRQKAIPGTMPAAPRGFD
jgi:RNA polymerase sigma-70 factor, ECF subfamily